MARQLLCVAAIVGIPFPLMAQESLPETTIQGSSQPQALTPPQLADLVAPIALYPDALLSQALVASTYPLEVVQAEQWLRRNDGLKGQELMDAAREQRWDASVQGLVAFPDALATLTQDIEWTTALGNAFLAQQSDVMAAVQRLRGQAQSKGTLTSNQRQRISTVVEDGQNAIEIEPADPQVIYVPQYDPVYVWGSPAWGAYPPLAYASGYGYGRGIDVGFWFGGWDWGWGWGWGPNWYGGSVYVNDAFFSHCGYSRGRYGNYYGNHYGDRYGNHYGDRYGNRYGDNRGGGRHGQQAGGHGGREAWQHDAGHRQGVPYSNERVASRYDAVSRASRTTANRGSWSRSGSEAASPYGSRSFTPGSRGNATDQAWRGGGRSVTSGSRGGGPDQAWRGGTRTTTPDARGDGADQTWRGSARSVTPGARGGGADPSWRTSGDQPRRSPDGPQGQGSYSRHSMTSPRDSSSSGYAAPRRSEPRDTAPSRSPSYAAPSRENRSSPRSASPVGGGRGDGGGGSSWSGGGGGRGVSGGSGGSHGGGGGHRR